MSVIVKGAFTATVLAVGSTSAYFLMTGKGNGPITLATDTDNKNNTPNEYSNKIGADFKYFLASPFNEKNKSFWEKAFKEWKVEADKQSSSLSDDFKKDEKVKKSFAVSSSSTETDDTKALNRVCHGIYKDKSKTDLSLDDANKKKLTTDLFTYCSALGGLPKTVKEAATGTTPHPYGTNNFGKTKEDKLIATTGNDTWWELKTKEFFAGQDPTSDTFFSSFYKGKKGSLRTKCEEAYKLPTNGSSNDSKPTESEVLKYCSLLGS